MTSDLIDPVSLEPSGRTLLALLPLFALAVGVAAYALMDLIRAPQVNYLPKVVWGLIIVLVSMPLGALAYLILGRSHGEPHSAGQDDGNQHEELHPR